MTTVFEKFVMQIAELSPDLAELLHGGTFALDAWAGDRDKNYAAGTELIVKTETSAAFQAIERTERLAELMTLACRRAGLTSVRIDDPLGKGILVFEANA